MLVFCFKFSKNKKSNTHIRCFCVYFASETERMSCFEVICHDKRFFSRYYFPQSVINCLHISRTALLFLFCFLVSPCVYVYAFLCTWYQHTSPLNGSHIRGYCFVYTFFFSFLLQSLIVMLVHLKGLSKSSTHTHTHTFLPFLRGFPPLGLLVI